MIAALLRVSRSVNSGEPSWAMSSGPGPEPPGEQVPREVIVAVPTRHGPTAARDRQQDAGRDHGRLELIEEHSLHHRASG